MFDTVRKPLKKELDQLIQLDIIQDVSEATDWVNFLVLVAEPEVDIIESAWTQAICTDLFAITMII